MTSVSSPLSRTMHDHWRVFLAEGVVLVIMGFAAIVLPPMADLATTIFLGWLLLIAGVRGDRSPQRGDRLMPRRLIRPSSPWA